MRDRGLPELYYVLKSPLQNASQDISSFLPGATSSDVQYIKEQLEMLDKSKLLQSTDLPHLLPRHQISPLIRRSKIVQILNHSCSFVHKTVNIEWKSLMPPSKGWIIDSHDFVTSFKYYYDLDSDARLYKILRDDIYMTQLEQVLFLRESRLQIYRDLALHLKSNRYHLVLSKLLRTCNLNDPTRQRQDYWDSRILRLYHDFRQEHELSKPSSTIRISHRRPLGVLPTEDIENVTEESVMPVQVCQGLISDNFRDPDFDRDNVKLPPQILATDILPDEPPPIQQPNQLLVYLATRVLSSNALEHNEPISMMDTLVQIDEGAAVNIMNRKLAIALEAKIDHDDDPYTICGIGGLCDGSQSCIVFLQFQHADNPEKRTSIRVKFILTDTLLGVPLLIGTHTMNGLRMRTNAHDISGIEGRVCRMGRGDQECYILHEPWAMVKLRSQGLNKTTFESGIQRLIYYSPAKTYETSEEMNNATSPSKVFSSTTSMISVNVTTVLHSSPTPKDPHFVVSAIYNSPPETTPVSPTVLPEANTTIEIPNHTSGELELQSVLAAVKSLQDTNQVIDDLLTEPDDDISELESYCLLGIDETGRPPLFPIKYWCKVFDDQRPEVVARWSVFSEERLQQILQELPNIDINPARPNQRDYLYAQMLANLDCYFIPNEEVPTPLKGFIYRIHTTTEEPQVARRSVQWSFLQKIYMEVKNETTNEGESGQSVF